MVSGQMAYHCEVLRPTGLATVAAVQQHVLKGVAGSGVKLCHVEGGTGHEARRCRALAQGTKVGSMFSRVQAQQCCSSPMQVIGCEAGAAQWIDITQSDRWEGELVAFPLI